MITIEQIRAARAMLGLKQHDLAQKAGLSTGTLNNIERGVQTDPKISTLRSIQKALEADGIEFTERESGIFGVQLRKQRNVSKDITLLIIDDSDADRKLYKIWLGKQPDRKYKIIEAGNAKDGYEAFLNNAPACIILDFMMYGKDGFQLLTEMRTEHTELPPIIFVTAMHNEVIKKEVLALGAYMYLDKKHLNQDTLYDAVDKALA